MLAAFQRKAAETLLRQRNFSYVVCTFLGSMCLILLLLVFKKTDRIIVVPSLTDPKKHYVFEGTHFSQDYLVDWASVLLADLFTANPKTIHRKNKTFLEWSLSTSSLSDELQKTAAALKKDNISTAFYPEDFQVFQNQRVLHVTGTFLTYLGRTGTPVVSKKTFALGWQVMAGGVLGVRLLEELKKEETKK